MHDHRDVLALAAAAIDFELDADEARRLTDGLEACSVCRRQVAAMRATATVLRRPLDIGTPGRVRDVVIGAALGHRNRAPVVRSFVAASLSIAILATGAAVLVGSRGLGLLPAPSPAASVPAATAAAIESVAPSPASPEPSVSPAPVPTPLPGDLLRSGDVVAMVTDGRLVIRTLPQTGPGSALFKTRLFPGQRALILEGPVDGDGYPWYRIRVGAIEGWASAADVDGTPWLSRVSNGTIAFVSGDNGAADGATEGIHAIDADDPTSEHVLFADPAITRYSQLAWSPDGRRLAFVGTPVDPLDAAPEVFVVDADGSNLVRLTTDDWIDGCPAWSPDSTRLAFRQEPVDPALLEDAGGASVVVVNADGTSAAALGPGECPAWSPDSANLAMAVVAGPDAPGVWIQAADGGIRRQLSADALASTTLGWSPDGLQIVVAIAGPTPDAAGLSRIDVETGSVTLLVHGPTASPAWSTAGTIAFSAITDGGVSLFSVGADGTDLRETAIDPGLADGAVWSPDGRRLLLVDPTGGAPITILDPASGRAEALSVEGTTGSAAWQPFLP